MAIRIRKINGEIIALNARLTKECDGDVYLDDSAHHALTTKFGVDFANMGFMKDSISDPDIKRLMLDEEWKCTCKVGEINPNCPIHN